MKLRCVIALLFLLSPFALHAQFAIYGNLDATHDSFSNSSTKVWLVGPNVGAYYNFVHAGPLAAGVDVRGNLLFGDQYKYRSALVGIRLAVKPPILPIRPYAQFSVGVGGARYTGPSPFPLPLQQ